MNNITKNNWKNFKRHEDTDASEPSVFSIRLRHYMEDAQVSVKSLAEELFLTPPTITGYRWGRRSPDVEKLALLVKSLDVSADYLIGQSDIPHPVYNKFTKKEYELVNEFRKLSSANQTCAIELIRNLAKQDSTSGKNA